MKLGLSSVMKLTNSLYKSLYLDIIVMCSKVISFFKKKRFVSSDGKLWLSKSNHIEIDADIIFDTVENSH